MATTRREFMKGGLVTAMLVAAGVKLDPNGVAELEFEEVPAALYAPQKFTWEDARPFDPRKTAIYVSFPAHGSFATAASQVWEEADVQAVLTDASEYPIYRQLRSGLYYSWQAILMGEPWDVAFNGLLSPSPHELWYMGPGGQVLSVSGCVPANVAWTPMERHHGGSVTVTGPAAKLLLTKVGV